MKKLITILVLITALTTQIFAVSAIGFCRKNGVKAAKEYTMLISDELANSCFFELTFSGVRPTYEKRVGSDSYYWYSIDEAYRAGELKDEDFEKFKKKGLKYVMLLIGD